MSWARQEYKRLNERAVLQAERLGQKPGASIPSACRNWAETVAAYRFLRNDEVGWEDILSAHARASMAWIREHAVVLCLQDTTELDYNGQAMSGLGPLFVPSRRLQTLILFHRESPSLGGDSRFTPIVVQVKPR
jgi:hypothetical protein